MTNATHSKTRALLFDESCEQCVTLANEVHAYSNHAVRLVPQGSNEGTNILARHYPMGPPNTYFLLEQNGEDTITGGSRAAFHLAGVVGIKNSMKLLNSYIRLGMASGRSETRQSRHCCGSESTHTVGRRDFLGTILKGAVAAVALPIVGSISLASTEPQQALVGASTSIPDLPSALTFLRNNFIDFGDGVKGGCQESFEITQRRIWTMNDNMLATRAFNRMADSTRATKSYNLCRNYHVANCQCVLNHYTDMNHLVDVIVNGQSNAQINIPPGCHCCKQLESRTIGGTTYSIRHEDSCINGVTDFQKVSNSPPGECNAGQCTACQYSDWNNYGDLVAYASLDALHRGNSATALDRYRRLYNWDNKVGITQMWDGKGIKDVATGSIYDSYKLALVRYLWIVLKAKANSSITYPSAINSTLGTIQYYHGNGGVPTGYTSSITPSGNANTETTAMTILAYKGWEVQV